LFVNVHERPQPKTTLKNAGIKFTRRRLRPHPWPLSEGEGEVLGERIKEN